MSENILINGPVTHSKISSVIESISNKIEAGGHSVFIGQVRADMVGRKAVKAIEYSAYENMVKKEADQIIKMIYAEFNDVKSISILHSVGIVKVGEASLFVLVSAGHRSHAMQACSKLVNMIKEKLPIWKKEIFEDNTHEWKQDSLA
jgi:molybdopterin synthase catalytic subunit